MIYIVESLDKERRYSLVGTYNTYEEALNSKEYRNKLESAAGLRPSVYVISAIKTKC